MTCKLFKKTLNFSRTYILNTFTQRHLINSLKASWYIRWFKPQIISNLFIAGIVVLPTIWLLGVGPFLLQNKDLHLTFSKCLGFTIQVRLIQTLTTSQMVELREWLKKIAKASIRNMIIIIWKRLRKSIYPKTTLIRKQGRRFMRKRITLILSKVLKIYPTYYADI